MSINKNKYMSTVTNHASGGFFQTNYAYRGILNNWVYHGMIQNSSAYSSTEGGARSTSYSDGPLRYITIDKNNDQVFVVLDKKIIGKMENSNITRLTYEDIINHPELWFLMDKWKEYLIFSHKSAILYEVFHHDLFYYLSEF